MADYIKPIAVSFTDAEDRLTEQKEMFKLGEQTCKKKMKDKLRMEQYVALKRFVLDIDERHDLSNLGHKIYAGRYVISAKNLVAIMDNEIVWLNKKNADLVENNNIAREQAHQDVKDLEEVEKARDDLVEQFYNLERKYAKLSDLYKRKKYEQNTIISNNKNVKHLIVLFYAMLIYMCICSIII